MDSKLTTVKDGFLDLKAKKSFELPDPLSPIIAKCLSINDPSGLKYL